ncbi:hypothetical protein LMG28138_04241 [Pararobbsia alpina]|uniref:Uncharacterized protein n=1 Tax=Pararobbsia alpina TaxID=621374 RepID=A0A6S7BY84_9BURK|nr:hypothetical protein LMG28138_04241 [Pararobbsia alpina]
MRSSFGRQIVRSTEKPMPGYTGRSWKDRLYADAIKAL